MDLKSTLHHPVQAAADMVATMPEDARTASHAFSIGALLSVFFHAIPTILSILGALLVVVWYGLNIYNHPVIQAWLARRKAAKQAQPAED